MATSSSNKSILELIELSRSYTDVPCSPPRISFSGQAAETGICFADCCPSDSEFEFSSTTIEAGQATTECSTADELFYNGKLLPLEPLSRMAMVEEEIGTMRRARSTRFPPAPAHFELEPRTRKSSSYPPPGRSSSSKWKDLFGLRKPQQQQQQQQDEAGRPTTGKLLRMFSRGKNQVAQMPPSPSSEASSKSSSRRSQPPTKPGRAGGGSRGSTPPGSPLSPYARASSRVAPVLHVPACIFDWKSFRGESSSRRSVEVL